MNDFPAAPPPSTPPATPWERAAIERLLMAQVNEAKVSRRWRIVKTLLWMALWVLLIVALFKGGSSSNADAIKQSAKHTAVVRIQGEIAPGFEASVENLLPGLKKAFEAKGAQAVVLHINSPGGSPVQAGVLNDEITRLKNQHKKKVIVVVDEMCASAAYYIAASADEIYVDKASIVGSIGVLMNGFGFTGTMEKLGVERRLLTAGASKGMLDPFSPMKEEDKLHVQTMLDQIHQQFIAVVRKGRGARLHENPDLFSGKFWTGEESIKLGLADKTGNLDFVARDVLKAEEIIDYTPTASLADRLAKQFGAAVGEGAYKAAVQRTTAFQ